MFSSSTLYSTATHLPTALGTTLTSQPSLLEQGVNGGYEVAFEFQKGSDANGVALCILDSSSPSGTTFFESGSQPMSCALVFRMVSGTRMIAYSPFYHPSWGSNRYFNPILNEQNIYGSRIPIPDNDWHTYTLRLWDKDASNFGMAYTNGANTQIQNIPKGYPGGSTYRAYLGRTSSWDGLALLGIPVNGALLSESYAGGSHISIGGAQIKNVTIGSLSASADHTQF